MHQVRCEKKELKDVHMPLPTQLPQSIKSVEEEEDQNRKIEELFEWVGMACLGSQR